MSKKIITIIGITGSQGGSVADTFLHDPTYTIRGITRDPTKPSAQSLTSKGISLVPGDLDDPASLAKAFAGSSLIFAVTDFWQHMYRPDVQQRAQREGKSLQVAAGEEEVRQGRNIVDAAAGTEGLELFVWSTLSDAKKWSKGKYESVYHFDGKAHVKDYLVERWPELAKKSSFVQVGCYATNFLDMGPLMPKKQDDGTYVLRLPGKDDRKISFAVPRDDTGHFVQALTKLPPGTELLGASFWATFPEFCSAWEKHCGVKVRYDGSMTVQDFDEMIPGGMGKELGDMFGFFGDFGYDGGDPNVVYPEKLDFDIPRTSLDEFVKKNDWSKVFTKD